MREKQNIRNQIEMCQEMAEHFKQDDKRRTYYLEKLEKLTGLLKGG